MTSLVCPYHGVGESIEEVLGCQQGHAMVAGGVPALPRLPLPGWHDGSGLCQLKVGVVFHYDHPGPVAGLQDRLQHVEVIVVTVFR